MILFFLACILITFGNLKNCFFFHLQFIISLNHLLAIKMNSTSPQSPSTRELLIKRHQNNKILQRLKGNISNLSKSQMRLDQSRLSDRSQSKSNSRISRVQSQSKVSYKNEKSTLLRNIADKLKQSRKIIEEKAAQECQEVNSSIISTSSKKSNKLEDMLKDIKRCNKLSTKAVYTIKKPNIYVKETFPPQRNNFEKESSSGILNSMKQVKKQMQNLKQQNQILMNIIHSKEKKYLQMSLNGQKGCKSCGCTCKISHSFLKSSLPQSYNEQSF